MPKEESDIYDNLTGPKLRETLGKRDLPKTGRVDELRERLRTDDKRKAEAQPFAACESYRFASFSNSIL